MKFKELFSLSRPRFWMYLAGPYLVGSAVQLHTFLTTSFWLHFLYFLIPANFFLYGINDLCDTDTDAHNTKKGSHEYKHKKSNHSFLKKLLLFLGLLSLGFVILQPSHTAQLLFVLFLFLSFFYSSTPLRFKAHPFVDSLSNVLYVIPGFIGYYHATHQLPSVVVIIGAWAWAASMHLFSAVPDIQSDTNAQLKTTAVVLGRKNALMLCSFLWLIASYAAFSMHAYVLMFLGIIYVKVPLFLLNKPVMLIEKVYWLFPLFNTLSGAVLFWYAI